MVFTNPAPLSPVSFATGPGRRPESNRHGSPWLHLKGATAFGGNGAA